MENRSCLGEREVKPVLDHTRKREDAIVHADVHARRYETGGKKRFDHVLQGVSVSRNSYGRMAPVMITGIERSGSS